LGSQQLSIHIKTLLDDLKSSKDYCPRNLFSGSKSSPEKSLQKNHSIFCLENQSCDRRDTLQKPFQNRFVSITKTAMHEKQFDMALFVRDLGHYLLFSFHIKSRQSSANGNALQTTARQASDFTQEALHATIGRYCARLKC